MTRKDFTLSFFKDPTADMNLNHSREIFRRMTHKDYIFSIFDFVSKLKHNSLLYEHKLERIRERCATGYFFSRKLYLYEALKSIFSLSRLMTTWNRLHSLELPHKSSMKFVSQLAFFLSIFSVLPDDLADGAHSEIFSFRFMQEKA